LSAGEFTPGGGVTDESTKVKGVVADPRLQARAVILDPALTVETPAWLWASTGMRALDHAVEGSYSTRHQLVTDTLASKAIALLNAHLLSSLQTHGDDELEYRVQCQLAAWLSIFGMSSYSRGGISHALGHQIGPMWNVPHGITSCITLPHVMRLMAGVAADRFAPIAQGFEVRFDPRSPRLIGDGMRRSHGQVHRQVRRADPASSRRRAARGDLANSRHGAGGSEAREYGGRRGNARGAGPVA